MLGLGAWRAVLLERLMAWSTAHDGNGTRLLFLIAAGESSPAGMVPGKQAAPWQLPGERGLGCPPLPCLPDAKLTEWMCREPRAAGWPREELADLFWQAAFRGRPGCRRASSQKQIN